VVEGFRERYFLRRRVDTEQQRTNFRASRVALDLRRGPQRTDGRAGDWWATTAFIPDQDGFAPAGAVGTVLVTGGPGRMRITDCYVTSWDDHFVARDGECNVTGTVALRTLGFLLDKQGAALASRAGLGSSPLYRCFDNSTKNHAVSLDKQCDGRGKTEFVLGYTMTRSQGR
jgi:hypothetical protein